MLNTLRNAGLAGIMVCLCGGVVSAATYTAPIPELTGVYTTYYSSAITVPIDFGQHFASVDQMTVTITADGYTGTGYVSMDPFGGGSPIDVYAELIVSVREPDGSDGEFIGVIGPYEGLVSDQVTENGPLNQFGDGVAQLSLSFNQVIVFGFFSMMDFPSMEIQSASVTIEAVSTASYGDPTGDGYVGLDDLDLVLNGWNQAVTPGDIWAGDLTGDGFVGLDDLDIVLNNWNAGTPLSVASLPEPMSLVIVMVLGSGLLVSRRN